MNISLQELRFFEKLSSPIKNNSILSIHKYVKFGGGRISKVFSHSFVEYECPSSDTDMLVDESLLGVKVGKSTSGFINFSKKGNKVTITDSIVPTTFQVPETKLFPTIPQPTSERFPLSENFTSVLKKAEHFPLTYDSGNISWMSFIMIGDGYIAASDGHAFFMEPVDEEFKLVLDNRHAQVISKLPIKEYAYSDNFMFFYGDNFTIGFAKQEIGYINITSKGHINGAKMEFVGSAADFQRFNDECAQSSKLPWVTISNGTLSMYDEGADTRVTMPMQNVTPSENFTYNAKRMNKVLTAIEGDEIEFYKGTAWYWIKSPDEKSTTLIMKLLDDNGQ